MTMADRIQALRKAKGISQEELADRIGVSRQAISKWESEQSNPDSPEVTKPDARIFTAAGTTLNFIGLISAVMIWVEEQTPVSVAVGLIIMAFGCMVGAIGQFIGENNVQARRWFFGINIWFLVLMPASCIFNVIQARGRHWWTFSPIPQFGNSLMSYPLFWLFYLVVCMSIDAVIFIRSKNGKQPKVAR